MLCKLIACAALGLFLTPALIAQRDTVCVFQTKAGNQLYNEPLANQLRVHGFGAATAAGVAKKDEDAEAHKRGCSWIVTIWHQGQMGGNFNRERPFWPALVAFNLRKTGSRKTIADANSDASDPVPYAKWADDIARKISKQE